jgi:predicted nucleotidyltransferase
MKAGEPKIPIITEKLEAIRALAREFEVVRLDVFGSVCTDEFDPERSDIDFLVEYPDDYDFGPWDARLNQLPSALADLLGRRFDLIEVRALQNAWFRQEAATTRQVVYDAVYLARAI